MVWGSSRGWSACLLSCSPCWSSWSCRGGSGWLSAAALAARIGVAGVAVAGWVVQSTGGMDGRRGGLGRVRGRHGLPMTSRAAIGRGSSSTGSRASQRGGTPECPRPVKSPRRSRGGRAAADALFYSGRPVLSCGLALFGRVKALIRSVSWVGGGMCPPSAWRRERRRSASLWACWALRWWPFA